MPWYRQGKVAITAGQTTVTGTGTDFSANARVGDAFQGPDGRRYEVVNIASATVLSILPAYQGVTVTGGAYYIEPVQGYPKDLTDQVKLIIQQWGDSLAGLGTAAMVDVTTSSLDTTAGRATKVGDFALGGASPVEAQANWKGNRFKAWNGAAAVDGPPTNRASIGLDMGYAVDRRAQLAIDVAGDAYIRGAQNNVSTSADWKKLVSSAGIVGAVSQSGGIPTGAIIESGSNAAGSYIKFANGTLICLRSDSYASVAITSPNGYVFVGPYIAGPAFAAEFIGVPFTTCMITGGTGLVWWTGGVIASKTNFHGLYPLHTTSFTTSMDVKWLAIGRWF
ncbi:hypothetical protein D3C77_358730 [compost metagenome]